MKQILAILLCILSSKLVSCQDDSHGSEFFIGMAKNIYVNDIVDLHITTTSTNAITFHIEDITGIFYTGTVALDAAVTVNITSDYIVQNSTYSNRNKGIRVYTDNGGLISVLVVDNFFSAIAEYIAYPLPQLNMAQYEYYTVSTTTLYNSNHHSLTLLVGTADDTNIIIIPSHTIIVPEDVQLSDSLDQVIVAGSAYVITLHRLQTFMFEADNFTDLTGSKIVSDKPLTVVSGHECSFLPNSFICEGIMIQVPPTATWGNTFLLVPYHGLDTTSEHYRMVAAESDTTITHNCLDDGQTDSTVLVGEGAALTFTIPSGRYCYAESNKPVFAAKLGAIGVSGLYSYFYDYYGYDIDWLQISMVPSTNSYTSTDILFYVPSYSGFIAHRINIMSTAPNPEIQMNGQALSLTWNTINNNNGAPVGYAAHTELLNVGEDHYISSNAPITTLVYGWNSESGYSYTAGVELYAMNQTNLSNRTISIDPWYGNILGGTLVKVSSTSFNPNDKIQCSFDGINVTATYLSTTSVVCVCPRLPKVGSTLLELYENDVAFDSTTTFYSLAPEHDNKATIDDNNVYYKSEDTFDLSWSTIKFISYDDTGISADDLLINITLHELVDQDDVVLAVLASGVENTGAMTLTVPSDGADLINQPSSEIVTVTIFIEATLKPGVSGVLENVTGMIGQWTGLVFATIGNQVNDILWQKCQEWDDAQPPSIGQTILDRVISTTPCPPNENQAIAVNSGLVRIGNGKLTSFLHPEADRCYRQRTITSANEGSGNQCCYKNSALLVGPSSGGTINKVAPGESMADYFLEDVIPYIYCCKGDQEVKKARCDIYYEHRPSDDGSTFQPPIPACIYGDPHVVTLDLHKYTFNGKGEFILVQTPYDYFTIQGRMEETQDTGGNDAGATVFTAIAAKQNDSRTVQFQLEYNGTDAYLVVLVDDMKLDFEIIQSQDFDNVTVTKMENNTLEASFSSGALIRVQEQNDIISLLLVSLPQTFINQTSGLMGSYNGDKTDDLMPRNGNTPLPLDSSLQTIHEDFGIHWIVKNATESLFSYPSGKDWSSFYFPDFVPIYEPTFSDPNLENMANSICQGDPFCIYDIATTQNTAIGQTTQQGGQDLENLIELSQPVSCDPSCVHGVCVDTNVCVCGEGYEGAICDTIVYSVCDFNPCNNSGVCQYHAGSYMCTCTPGYSGPFCDTELPRSTSSVPPSTTTTSTSVPPPKTPTSSVSLTETSTIKSSPTTTSTIPSPTTSTSISPPTETASTVPPAEATVSIGVIVIPIICFIILILSLVAILLACYCCYQRRDKKKLDHAVKYQKSDSAHENVDLHVGTKSDQLP